MWKDGRGEGSGEGRGLCTRCILCHLPVLKMTLFLRHQSNIKNLKKIASKISHRNKHVFKIKRPVVVLPSTSEIPVSSSSSSSQSVTDRRDIATVTISAPPKTDHQTTIPSSLNKAKIKKTPVKTTPYVDWQGKYEYVGNVKKGVRCVLCQDKILSTFEHFKRHYIIVHLGRRYRCPECGRQDKCKKTYYGHINDCHGDHSKIPECIYNKEESVIPYRLPIKTKRRRR